MIQSIHHDSQEFIMSYPPPPQGAFALDMGLASPTSHHGYARASALELYPHTLDLDTSGVPMFNASYHEVEMRRIPSSSMSTTSGSPSAMGSPLSNPGQLGAPLPEWPSPYGLGMMSPGPGIVDQPDCYAYNNTAEYAFQPACEYGGKPPPGFVDPSLIHSDVNMMPMRPMAMTPCENTFHASNTAYPASPALSASPQLRNGSVSPFLTNTFHQYPPVPGPMPVDPEARRCSLGSFYSAEPPNSRDEAKDVKQRCQHPDCGKSFKDLRAHMLTHQTERPEKCPIASCDYHIKGFARK